MEIRAFTMADCPAAKAIYVEGIANGQATFQTDAPEWAAWDGSHLPHSRFATIDTGMVAGRAALSPVSGRCVYAGVAEISVYIGTLYRGRGIGNALARAIRAPQPPHRNQLITHKKQLS